MPRDDPEYNRLQTLQKEGTSYKNEQIELLNTGEFVYQPYLDLARDFITKHGEAAQRISGAADLLAGASGTVAGGLMAAGGVLACAPTAATSCVLVPLGAYFAIASSQQANEGSKHIFGKYQSMEGHRVFSSLIPGTHLGERDPLKETAIEAGKLGATITAAKIIPKLITKSEKIIFSSAKSSANEYIPSPDKNSLPVNIDGNFQTMGLRDIEPAQLPDGIIMIRKLESTGFSREEAAYMVKQFIRSGKTKPISTPIDDTDNLFKIFPSGGTPSSTTAYWMRKEELDKLSIDPKAIADKLGLPPGMHSEKYDIYSTKPMENTIVFESKIAETMVDNIPYGSGGATQIIVIDRSAFTKPIKTGTIDLKR